MNPKGTQNKNRAIRPPTFPFGNFEMLGTFPMRVSYLYKLVHISYKLNSKHLKPTGIGKCSSLFTSPNYCGFLVSNRYSFSIRWSERKIPNSWYMFQPLRYPSLVQRHLFPSEKSSTPESAVIPGCPSYDWWHPTLGDDTRPGSRKISPKRPSKLQPAMVYQGNSGDYDIWNIIQYYPMKQFEATMGTVGTMIGGSINEYGIIYHPTPNMSKCSSYKTILDRKKTSWNRIKTILNHIKPILNLPLLRSGITRSPPKPGHVQGPLATQGSGATDPLGARAAVHGG